ncbi:MAG: hypothetical protein AAGF87_03425 [Bacteroidota bacterium]
MQSFHLILLFIFSGLVSVHAQVSVSYGDAVFGSCEIVRAGIGNTGESLSLVISEINMDRPELLSDNIDAPDNYQLILEVSLPDGVPFPITSELRNQLTIDKSSIRHGMEDQAYFEAQMAANADQFRVREQAAAAAQDDKASIEERSREIAMKMQSGEISIEEGTNQLEAIMQEANTLIASIPEEPEIDDLAEPALYSIIFSDQRDDTESKPIEGQLLISKFTETEFVATFTGRHVVECYSARAVATSGDECTQVESALMPGTEVLTEGDISISIHVQLKEFNDHR